MELDYSMIAKTLSVAILASVLCYVLLAFYRQARALRIDENVTTLRLKSLQEQVRYLGLRATQIEAKKQNAWAGTRKFRLDQIVKEADKVCSFYLAPHDGQPIPAFDPGQYLTFELDIPGQNRSVIRCYSLSDTPLASDRYRVTVKLIDPSAANPHQAYGISSGYFHTVLKEGDILDCKAPSGNFYLDMAEHSPIVLVAGGIGVTPLLSMVRTVALSGSKRETWLFYGVHNGSELIKGSHLRELAENHENIHLHLCFNDAADADVAGIDYDHAEQVSVDLIQRVLPSTNYEYYVCGPASMIKSITEGLAEVGVPNEKVHYESFGSASVHPRGNTTPDKKAGVRYKVTFAKSGKQLDWTPEHGSLLDFAEASDIALDCGCRAGSCGSCAIAVREGEVDYIDEISAQPEKGSCLACLAVPVRDIVIDA